MSVFVKNYVAPLVREREILRYAGLPDTAEIRGMINEALELALPLCEYRTCFLLCDVLHKEDKLYIGSLQTGSKQLMQNLKNCDRCVLFAATLGLGIDRLIKKCTITAPATAVLLQAVATERIEALCNVFCKELMEEYGSLCPRFSPGYGDLPLALQRDIFEILDCPRSIGVTLRESLLMVPTKSVTAFVGIKE